MKGARFFLAVLFLYALLVSAALAVLVQSLGGWQYIYFKVTHNAGATATRVSRMEVFDMLPVDENSIVMLGDSNLAQPEWQEMFGSCDIRNRAISGDTAVGMLGRVDYIIANNPKKIFIMAGTNDLFNTKDAALTVSNVLALVKHVLDKRDSTTVYLQSILPVNNEISKHYIENEKIQYVNAELKKYCGVNGVEFIDIGTLLQDEQGNLATKFTYDGVHVNGLGYIVWKNALSKYM